MEAFSKNIDWNNNYDARRSSDETEIMKNSSSNEKLIMNQRTEGSETIVSEHEMASWSDSSSSVINEDEQGKSNGEVDLRRRRKSSLKKENPTPPESPTKKNVKFADAMEMDLIDIKTFVDEIPRVPKEAYSDLHIPDYTSHAKDKSDNFSNSNSSDTLNNLRNSCFNFVPLFHHPSSIHDVFDKIRDQKILLENAYITQETMQNNKTNQSVCRHVIKGTVYVMNMDFHKSVYIRYTYNDWQEFIDFPATYIPGSCDGFIERFEFKIELDESCFSSHNITTDNANIQFACMFLCQGSQFWDNNQSRNYVFQNVPLHNTLQPTNPCLQCNGFEDFECEEKQLKKAVQPPLPLPPTPVKELEVKQAEIRSRCYQLSLYGSMKFYERSYRSKRVWNA